jgi:hypothetical protein
VGLDVYPYLENPGGDRFDWIVLQVRVLGFLVIRESSIPRVLIWLLFMSWIRSIVYSLHLGVLD